MNTQDALEKKLPLESLVDGNVYSVRARNFNFGMWDGRAFVGRRCKFGGIFLADEYYWGDDWGSCIPLVDLGPAPTDTDTDLLTHLIKLEELL